APWHTGSGQSDALVTLRGRLAPRLGMREEAGAAGNLLSCRGPPWQGRSPDDSPFFLHGCRALAARRRGQGGAPGAQRGRTTLRTATCSKTIRQAGEEGIRP